MQHAATNTCRALNRAPARRGLHSFPAFLAHAQRPGATADVRAAETAAEYHIDHIKYHIEAKHQPLATSTDGVTWVEPPPRANVGPIGRSYNARGVAAGPADEIFSTAAGFSGITPPSDQRSMSLFTDAECLTLALRAEAMAAAARGTSAPKPLEHTDMPWSLSHHKPKRRASHTDQKRSIFTAAGRPASSHLTAKACKVASTANLNIDWTKVFNFTIG